MRSIHSYTDKEKLELTKKTLPSKKISGVSFAKELGLSKTTVYGWKKKF